jgi:hypothetical protein
MITVPRRPLLEMEDGFLRLWLTVNNVTAQIEMGTDARIFGPLLRQELGHALEKFYRSARRSGRREEDRHERSSNPSGIG